MVTVELDTEREAQLRRLAEAQQEDVPQLVRRVLEDFLDIQALTEISEEDLAEASVAMLAEVAPLESWDEDADETR